MSFLFFMLAVLCFTIAIMAIPFALSNVDVFLNGLLAFVFFTIFGGLSYITAEQATGLQLIKNEQIPIERIQIVDTPNFFGIVIDKHLCTSFTYAESLLLKNKQFSIYDQTFLPKIHKISSETKIIKIFDPKGNTIATIPND